MRVIWHLRPLVARSIRPPANQGIEAVTRVERLLCQARRIKSVLRELQDVGNHRDQAARITEIKGYMKLFSLEFERLENEHFRKNPELGLQRAMARYNSMQKSFEQSDEKPENADEMQK